jgi:hypothetical protein
MRKQKKKPPDPEMRATPYELYVKWRSLRAAAAADNTASRKHPTFHVNPFILLFTDEPTHVAWFYLHRFCVSVPLPTVYSPALFIALWIAARLFRHDPACISSTFPRLVLSSRSKTAIAVYNRQFSTLEVGEILEMTQLAREYIRPSEAVATRFMKTHGWFVDDSVIAVLGRSSPSTISNDAYRLGMLMVLFRATLAPTEWAALTHHLWRSGVVLHRSLERLKKIYALVPRDCVTEDERRALFSQFSNPRQRFATQLGMATIKK